MDFSKIFEDDLPCDCLDKCFEDCSTVYMRKLNRDSVVLKDFESKWEKNQYRSEEERNAWEREIRAQGCKRICGAKGVSVSKLADPAHENIIMENIREAFTNTRRYRPNVAFFKFKQGDGLLLDKPSNAIKYHHDFYKSDTFDCTQLEIVKVIPL